MVSESELFMTRWGDEPFDMVDTLADHGMVMYSYYDNGKFFIVVNAHIFNCTNYSDDVTLGDLTILNYYQSTDVDGNMLFVSHLLNKCPVTGVDSRDCPDARFLDILDAIYHGNYARYEGYVAFKKVPAG